MGGSANLDVLAPDSTFLREEFGHWRLGGSPGQRVPCVFGQRLNGYHPFEGFAVVIYFTLALRPYYSSKRSQSPCDGRCVLRPDECSFSEVAVAHALSARAVSLCSPPVAVRLGREKGPLVVMLLGCGRWPTCLVLAGLATELATELAPGVFQASA